LTDLTFPFRSQQEGEEYMESKVKKATAKLPKPNEHRDKYALIKELTDWVAREPSKERMVWYLNRFLRMADDAREGRE
jgi:hypothetical protein